MFGSKATEKEVFDKIAEQFTKISGRLVTGEQCMRKWGKITSKQKEIEDHNLGQFRPICCKSIVDHCTLDVGVKYCYPFSEAHSKIESI